MLLISLAIIWQESELIDIICYLYNIIIFVKSVVKKNENNYYFNIFSVSYEDKSNTKYF